MNVEYTDMSMLISESQGMWWNSENRLFITVMKSPHHMNQIYRGLFLFNVDISTGGLSSYVNNPWDLSDGGNVHGRSLVLTPSFDQTKLYIGGNFKYDTGPDQFAPAIYTIDISSASFSPSSKTLTFHHEVSTSRLQASWPFVNHLYNTGEASGDLYGSVARWPNLDNQSYDSDTLIFKAQMSNKQLDFVQINLYKTTFVSGMHMETGNGRIHGILGTIDGPNTMVKVHFVRVDFSTNVMYYKEVLDYSIANQNYFSAHFSKLVSD